MKKKILIFSPGIIITNDFFIQYPSFKDIVDDFDVYVCCNADHKGSDPKLFSNMGFKEVFEHHLSKKREKTKHWQLHINTVGARRLSRHANIIYTMNKKDYGRFNARLVHRIFGCTPTTAKWANDLFERYIGEDRTIKEIIDSVRPDLIITFLAGAGALEIESTKAGKTNNIPVLGIQAAWDRIGGRGLLPFRPDYMGVWGYQSRIIAERLQKMPPERIVHIGAPFGDALKRPPQQSDAAIRAALGLPAGKRVLMFAGNIWAYNEVRNLKIFNDAIESGKLADCCIFYRPHPFQHRAKDDIEFSKQNFKHIYLDPQLADEYTQAHQQKRAYAFSKTKVGIDFRHLKDVMSVLSGVINPLGTMIIQGAMCGVPSVVILYVDRANERYWRRCECEHFDIIRGMPGIILCLGPNELIECCQRALDFSKKTSAIDVMKNTVKSVVYDDELAFSQRVRHAVDAILYPDRRSIYNFLHKPVLDLTKKQNVIDFT